MAIIETELTEYGWRSKPAGAGGTVIAHRWQDTSGNTYHRVYCYGADGTVKMSAKTYGYGNAWEVTTREILNLPPIQDHAGTLTEMGWHTHTVDVTRQRDL